MKSNISFSVVFSGIHNIIIAINELAVSEGQTKPHRVNDCLSVFNFYLMHNLLKLTFDLAHGFIAMFILDFI